MASSASPMEDPHNPLHQTLSFDCEKSSVCKDGVSSNQQRSGKIEVSRRKICLLCSSVLAVSAAALLGCFVVAPLFQKASTTSEQHSQHAQIFQKAAFLRLGAVRHTVQSPPTLPKVALLPHSNSPLTMLSLPKKSPAALFNLPLPHLAGGRTSDTQMSTAEEEKLLVDVRQLPKSAIALDCTVPPKVANEIHMKTIEYFASKVKIQGYRDGKAPANAVMGKVGRQVVKERTVEDLANYAMQQSGISQKVQTIGEFKLSEDLSKIADRYKIGEGLSFTLECDVMPVAPVDEAKYKALSVEVEKEELNQAAYGASLLKLQKEHADIVDEPAGTAAEMGNQISVNMNGFFANTDGSKGAALPNIAGGTAVTVPMEQGKFMPGLVEGLVGVKEGEKREIAVTFPPRTSAPQVAGKDAIFEVECLKVQSKHLAEPNDAFANRIKEGLTWAEVDARIRETIADDAKEKTKAKTDQAIEKALVDTLPDSFEIPETLLEKVTKERFAMMMADLRNRGETDEKLKEMVTPEGYENYKQISIKQTLRYIKANFAIQAVAKQQGLTVTTDQVDDEVMTLQAQALQRGEKFKESEVRGKVQSQLEKNAVMNWLEQYATVNLIEPKGEADPTEILGQTPEELAARIKESEAAKKEKEAAKAN